MPTGQACSVLARAGVKHRRIYDLRHTYATWSLAAGVDIFTLARRMGTSVQMIARTYGHLVAGADAYERELLDGFDTRRSQPLAADIAVPFRVSAMRGAAIRPISRSRARRRSVVIEGAARRGRG